VTSTPNPTWYDVLGVERHATPDEIKAAWRNATDKFEPGSGSGQFRMFNEAADVLLDPSSRAAYDASLPAEPSIAPTEPAMPAEPQPQEEEEAGLAPPPPLPSHVDESPARRGSSARSASRLTVIVTAVLALLTVAALVLAVILGLKVRTDSQIADARDQAPTAAEKAAVAVFQYDYRHLPADRKRAESYLTGSYKKEYEKTATLLEKQKDGSAGLAVQTKAVVTSSVLGSAVMDAEPDVARVLVYVNLTSTKGSAAPKIFENRVAMTMHKDGDRWLLAKVATY